MHFNLINPSMDMNSSLVYVTLLVAVAWQNLGTENPDYGNVNIDSWSYLVKLVQANVVYVF